jgi:hypothetical protein
MADGWDRRRCVRAVGAAAACVLAGCAGAGADRDEVFGSVAVAGDCADGFAVTEERARVERGSVPSVDLRLANEGEVAVDYRVEVVFRQGTSLGLPVRSGRAVLSGTLAPGATRVETATGDGRDAQNSIRYEVDATATCSG